MLCLLVVAASLLSSERDAGSAVGLVDSDFKVGGAGLFSNQVVNNDFEFQGFRGVLSDMHPKTAQRKAFLNRPMLHTGPARNPFEAAAHRSVSWTLPPRHQIEIDRCGPFSLLISSEPTHSQKVQLRVCCAILKGIGLRGRGGSPRVQQHDIVCLKNRFELSLRTLPAT